MSGASREASWFAPDAVVRVSDDLAVVLVRGCASRFVKRAAYYRQHASWVRRPSEIDALAETEPLGDTLPWPADSGRLVALWRDPVERFAAVFAEWCIERVPHPYAAYATLQVDADWHRFLQFAAWELSKGDPATMVEHLRPQSGTWTRSAVSEVVGVDQVRELLRRHGVRYRPFVAPVRRHVPAPPAAVAGAVRRLYEADYELRP